MRYLLLTIQLVVIAMLLPVEKTHAQFQFVKSTVWFNNGDSAVGWIDKVGLDNHPNRIRFKLNKNDGEHIFYTAVEIKSFKIGEGNAYIGYVGMVDSGHLFQVAGPITVNPGRIRDTMFLQQLVPGKANLYFGKDHGNITHFFIQIANKPVAELHYYRIVWSKKGTDVGIFQKVSYYQIERKIYKQQMLEVFSDCNEVFKSLAEAATNYTGTNLAKWFRLYNNQHCVG